MVGPVLEDGDCACTDEIIFPCGCEVDEHTVRTYRDHAMHWRGKHWRAGCLARAATVEMQRFEDALRMVAGDVDSCGYSHGSTLHDIIKMGRLAERVLAGEDPHEVVASM